MSQDDEFMDEFVIEAQEHLADIEADFLALEECSEELDVDLVNKIFRAIHSIKGASGFFGLSKIGALSHVMENVLNPIRNGELTPTSEIVDTLLSASDVLSNLIDDVHHSNEVDVSEHVAAVEALLEANGPDSEESDSEQQALESKEEGSPEPATDAGSSEENAKTTEASVVPAVQEDEPSIATQESPVAKKSLDQQATPVAGRKSPKPSTGSGSARPSSGPESNLRVPVSLLDHLMNLAGELVLCRNQLLQAVHSSDERYLETVASRLDQVTSEAQESIMKTRMQAIGTVFSRFPRIVRDLSKKLGKDCELVITGNDVEVDKSIIEAIGDPLTHLIRNSVDHGIEMPQARKAQQKSQGGRILLEAYHQAGKVNIAIRDDGGGIDTDRLKQKAVENGVLTPEQAQAMGKREAARLIFNAGLSTAKEVTDVSGRGVGMDVVRTNIEKLGGMIEVETEVGKGTDIVITLPLTLAIIPSLLVRSGRQRYAIPQGNISELVRIRPQEVSSKLERIRDAEVLRLRGNLLPLLRLSSVLETESHYRDAMTRESHENRRVSLVDARQETSEASEADELNGSADSEPSVDRRENPTTGALHVIVVEAGPLRFGLIVDGVDDPHEIVVKPLGRHLRGNSRFAGATVLGDGEVALILDIVGIATHVQFSDSSGSDSQELAGSDEFSESQIFLLFRSHIEEIFAVPIAAIQRIERAPVSKLSQIGRKLLLQKQGGSLPVVELESCIDALPREDRANVFVLVCKIKNREIGVIASRLMDMAELSGDLDSVTLTAPGVLGSVSLAGQTARVLDLYELVRGAHPEWFGGDDRADDSDRPRILLAEDSTIMRHQLRSLLESEGFEVEARENGQEAFDALTGSVRPFHLLVTDIEMPIMNGLELTRRIRVHPEYSELPIIAVSSLSSDGDFKRGVEAGVDDYQTKLKGEALVKSIRRHLRRAPVAVNA